jgi:hypothetical protein
MSENVYLPHLEPRLPVTAGRIARHHLGFTEGAVEDRLSQHLAGRGSPLVRAVIAAGGSVTVERTPNNADRSFERSLKRRHETPRLCPRCVRAGHTNGRGPLLLLQPPVTGAPARGARPRKPPLARPVSRDTPPGLRIGR